MPGKTKKERAEIKARAYSAAAEDDSPDYPYDDAPAEGYMTRVKKTSDTLGNQKHIRRYLSLVNK
jgi:hypothetical protein